MLNIFMAIAQLTCSASNNNINITTISYHWQYKSGLDYIDIPNATSSTFTTNITSLDQYNQYRCKVSNGYKTVYSDPASVIIYDCAIEKPEIEINKINNNSYNIVCKPSYKDTNFINEYGSKLPSTIYKWLSATTKTGTYVEISDEITSTLSDKDPNLDKAYFKCVVSYNSYDGEINEDNKLPTNSVTKYLTSDPIRFTNFSFKITNHPTASDIKIGDTYDITCVAKYDDGEDEESLPDLKYQWYKDDEEIEGATSSSYTIPTSASSIHEYYCVVTNNIHTLTSNKCTVLVYDPGMEIITEPNDLEQEIKWRNGNYVYPALKFTCSNKDPEYIPNKYKTITYKWYKNGAYYSSGSILNVTEVGQYKCEATNGIDIKNTSEINITKYNYDFTLSIPEKVIANLKTLESISAIATVKDDRDKIVPIQYTWYKNNTVLYSVANVRQSTSSPYTLTLHSEYEDSGGKWQDEDYSESKYYCIVSCADIKHKSDDCTVIDTRIGISSPLKYDESSKQLTSTCKLSSTNWTPSTLSAIVYKNGNEYYKTGNIADDMSNGQYTLKYDVTKSGKYNYKFTVGDGTIICGTVETQEFTACTDYSIRVKENDSNKGIYTPQHGIGVILKYVCYNNDSYNKYPINYQWYKDGKPISGANKSTYNTDFSTKEDNIYYCIATNIKGFTATPQLNVTVKRIELSVNVTGDSEYNTSALTANVNINDPYNPIYKDDIQYTWYKDNIKQLNNTTNTVSNLDYGKWYCEVSIPYTNITAESNLYTVKNGNFDTSIIKSSNTDKEEGCTITTTATNTELPSDSFTYTYIYPDSVDEKIIDKQTMSTIIVYAPGKYKCDIYNKLTKKTKTVSIDIDVSDIMYKKVVFVDVNAPLAGDGTSWESPLSHISLVDTESVNIPAGTLDAPCEVWVKGDIDFNKDYVLTKYGTIAKSHIHMYGGFNGTEYTRRQKSSKTYTTITQYTGTNVTNTLIIDNNTTHLLNIKLCDMQFITPTTSKIYPVIRANNTEISLLSCNFIGINKHNNFGIYILDNTVIDIESCEFNNLNAAIYYDKNNSTNKLNISKSSFNNLGVPNDTSGDAGTGISIKTDNTPTTDIHVCSSIFNGSKNAPILLLRGKTTLNCYHCEFKNSTDSTALLYQSLIHIDHVYHPTKAEFNSCTFYNNTAMTSIIGYYSHQETTATATAYLSCINCFFIDNVFKPYSGSLEINPYQSCINLGKYSNTTILHTTFSNWLGCVDGCLHLMANTNTSIKNCIFSTTDIQNNKVIVCGGGTNQIISMQHCAVPNNSANIDIADRTNTVLFENISTFDNTTVLDYTKTNIYPIGYVSVKPDMVNTLKGSYIISKDALNYTRNNPPTLGAKE